MGGKSQNMSPKNGLETNLNFFGDIFNIFRSPNVNLGMNARVREKSLPPPINKKYNIASLFWSNELLTSQKPW